MPEQLTTEQMLAWVNQWVQAELAEMMCAVLGTCDDGVPKTRTVAIHLSESIDPVFFTQLGSGKVKQIEANSNVSMTLQLPEHRRQITWSGQAVALTKDERRLHWDAYPRPSQQRFMIYGPRSGDAIDGNDDLDRALNDLQTQPGEAPYPMPPSYVGYRVHVDQMAMYQMNLDRLSDSWRLQLDGDVWQVQRCVP